MFSPEAAVAFLSSRNSLRARPPLKKRSPFFETEIFFSIKFENHKTKCL